MQSVSDLLAAIVDELGQIHDLPVDPREAPVQSRSISAVEGCGFQPLCVGSNHAMLSYDGLLRVSVKARRVYLRTLCKWPADQIPSFKDDRITPGALIVGQKAASVTI